MILSDMEYYEYEQYLVDRALSEFFGDEEDEGVQWDEARSINI